MSLPPEPPAAHGYGSWGPGYGPAFGPAFGPPVVRPTNSRATASLVTGIAALVLSWCCGLGILGVVPIVLGLKARKEVAQSGGTQQGDGLALGGIITGAIAVVVGLLVLVVIGLAVVMGAQLEVTTSTDGTSL